MDKEIPNLIQSVKQDFDYVVDLHTACAFKDLDPEKKAVILATAHPAKFPAVYQQAGMEIPYSSSLEALKSRNLALMKCRLILHRFDRSFSRKFQQNKNEYE